MLAYNCLQCYLVIIYLCFISYNFFYFIIYFGHFLNKADLTVNNLSLIKKKTALEDFHIFYFCLISDWFPPWFSLVPSFCWCWVLFIPLFLIPLVKVRLCEVFCVSWGRPVLLQTPLLELALQRPKVSGRCASVSSASGCALRSLLASSVIHQLFSSTLFSPRVFVGFAGFFLFCSWILVS